MTREIQRVKWAEYKIDDLFEKIRTKNITKNEAGNLPATTAILSNNQIGRYVSRDNATILKNVFSATANGSGRAFYQPHEFTVFQDSYAFKFKDDSIDISKIHPFIVSALNRVYIKYNWSNKSGWEKIKKEKILLPTKDEKIDFEFMKNFVDQMKTFHLLQLNAYLSTTGLNDYTLSVDESRAISDFENGEVEWGGV